RDGTVDRLRAVRSAEHAKSSAIQMCADQSLDERFVVGYEDTLAFGQPLAPRTAWRSFATTSGAGHSSGRSAIGGNVNTKVLPSPGCESTQMCPPCDSTRLRQMNNPSPTPLTDRPDVSTR